MLSGIQVEGGLGLSWPHPPLLSLHSRIPSQLAQVGLQKLTLQGAMGVIHLLLLPAPFLLTCLGLGGAEEGVVEKMGRQVGVLVVTDLILALILF